MSVVTLPRILSVELNLAELNQRLRMGQVRLDWTGVEQADAPELATLLWGLDLVDHADVLGIDTVPEPLQTQILGIVTAAPPKRPPRKAKLYEPDVLPLTWRPEDHSPSMQGPEHRADGDPLPSPVCCGHRRRRGCGPS